MKDNEFEADVIVVGGGPGGSTVATLCARAGLDVVLLERESRPAYKIGESLLPATVHGICPLLGVDDALARAGFTVKHGGTFRWGGDDAPWTFSFALSPQFAGATSTAYQVERVVFDRLLLDNAETAGVRVMRGVTATGVMEELGKATGVSCRRGEEHWDMKCRWVVDASGNSGRLTATLGGERLYSDFFRNIAVFGYFRGGGRLPEPNSGNILTASFDDGWCWYIPLRPDLTSVGVVVDRSRHPQIGRDREKSYRDLLAECDLVTELIGDTPMVDSGMYSGIRVRKDYSYSRTQMWGDHWVSVGDAACFVDPVFSSGVHLATYSGLLAARSIISVLSDGMDTSTAFDEFDRRYRREYSVFYEFLAAFYAMNSGSGGRFWAAKKVTGTDLPEDAAFVDLVAGGSVGEALFGGGSAVDRIHRGGLDMASAAGADSFAMHAVSVASDAMAASIDLQTGGETHSVDGLGISEDRLRWRHTVTSGAGTR